MNNELIELSNEFIEWIKEIEKNIFDNKIKDYVIIMYKKDTINESVHKVFKNIYTLKKNIASEINLLDSRYGIFFRLFETI